MLPISCGSLPALMSFEWLIVLDDDKKYLIYHTQSRNAPICTCPLGFHCSYRAINLLRIIFVWNFVTWFYAKIIVHRSNLDRSPYLLQFSILHLGHSYFSWEVVLEMATAMECNLIHILVRFLLKPLSFLVVFSDISFLPVLDYLPRIRFDYFVFSDNGMF